MTKLKSASDWEEIWEDSDMMTLQEVIKQAQQNAIEAALEVAALESNTFYDWTDGETRINKQSITSLINHPNLKL